MTPRDDTARVRPRVRLRRVLLAASLVALILLIALSVFSTFLGAEAAGRWFNSPPLAALWCSVAALLLAGLVVGAVRRTGAGVLAMHAGCLLILVGGMIGSPAAGDLRTSVLGDQRMARGRVLAQRDRPRRQAVIEEDTRLRDLDFSLRLDGLEVAHYGRADWQLACSLGRRNEAGEILYGEDPRHIDWRLGREVTVPHTDASLRVLMHVEPGSGPIDGPLPPPAFEFVVRRGDAEVRQGLGPGVGRVWPMRELYADEQAWAAAGLPFIELYAPERPVRRLAATLTALRDGQEEAQAVIEANRPMHYDGYHIYLEDYDREQGEWALLLLVSDAGLAWVFTGFAVLGAGAAWQFWLAPVARALRRRVSP